MNQIFREIKRWPIVVLVLAGLGGTLTANTGAVVGDTYIDSASSTVNFGSNTAVVVSPTAEGLLQFDLSTVPASASIKRATLVLFVSKVTASGVVSVLPVTTAWAEGAATAAAAPTTGAPTGSFAAAQQGLFVSVDLTSLVQSWVNTPSSNFGIALNSGSGASASFDSRESTTTSHAAFLSIDVLSTGSVGPGGAAGNQGDIGASGPIGGTGPQGSQGARGPSGPAGPDVSGPQGPQGPPGAQGQQGPQGAQGIPGGTGSTGLTGSPGSQGPQGSQGGAGSAGPTGSDGLPGNQGNQGPAGNQGAGGSSGSQGTNSPFQNVLSASGSGSATISGATTILGTDTHEMFFIAATDTSANGQLITLPPAVAGKSIWIIGNYTSTGNVFSIAAGAGDTIYQPGGTASASHTKINFGVHLIGGSSHDWHEVTAQ